jgi:hypothetical protein
MFCFFCRRLFARRRLRRRIAFFLWIRLNSLLDTNHLLRRTVLRTPLRDTFFRKRFIICFCDSFGRNSTFTAKTTHILSFRLSHRKGEALPHPFWFGAYNGLILLYRNICGPIRFAYLPPSIPLKTYNAMLITLIILRNAYIDHHFRLC